MVRPELIVEVDPVAGTADVHGAKGEHLLGVSAAAILVKLHGDEGIIYLSIGGRTVEAAYQDYPGPLVAPSVGPGEEPGWLALSAP